MTEKLEARLTASRALVESATRRLDEAQAERDAVIAEALAAGWSLRQVAKAVGVTFGRVRQIDEKLKKEASGG